MKVYGGFISGKLDWLKVDDGFGGHNWRNTPALFRKRQEARCQYEDVRPIEIQEAPRKRLRKR
jgi:hypothetical protein